LLGRFVLVLAGLDVRASKLKFDDWDQMAHLLVPTLALFAAITATFGNLAAYLQTNLKRLLAYSTIAHAGYMMMGLAALTKEGAAAVLFYLVAYLFMNLGAFAVVAFLRNQTGSEDLTSFRGLIRRSPLLVVTLGVFLLSLLGVPPLVGFAAKLQIFSVLFNAGNHYHTVGEPALGSILYALLAIGGLNTVISAVYYLKVLKVMVLETPLEEVEGREPVPLKLQGGWELYATLLALVILVLGILWDPLLGASQKGVNRFQSMPQRANGPVAEAIKAGGL
jgi:NADH-quinone oxidoreductase subunit N